MGYLTHILPVLHCLKRGIAFVSSSLCTSVNSMFVLFVGEIRDVPLILYVPLLTPCLDSEKLCVAVDLMKGMFLVSLAQKGLMSM